jgi:hypothetical protein
MKKRGRSGGHGRHRARRVAVNEFVDQAPLEDVLRALERLPVDLDWTLVAPNVVPLLPLRRPMPALGDPLRVLLPPGIMTGFGIDAGPAVMHVGPEALERWSIDVGELTARALGNVRFRTQRQRPRDVRKERLDGTVVRLLQTGEGVASALLLVADELTRLFGDQPAWFIAPMRDVLIAVDGSADPTFVAWLSAEMAAMDPNALAVDPFRWQDRRLRLEPVDRLTAGGVLGVG